MLKLGICMTLAINVTLIRVHPTKNESKVKRLMWMSLLLAMSYTVSHPTS